MDSFVNDSRHHTKHVDSLALWRVNSGDELTVAPLPSRENKSHGENVSPELKQIMRCIRTAHVLTPSPYLTPICVNIFAHVRHHASACSDHHRLHFIYLHVLVKQFWRHKDGRRLGMAGEII
jgi:hypothetical protein